MVRSLFPQDTRAVELCSAGALILIAISLALSNNLYLPALGTHASVAWVVFFGCLGGVQLVTLVMYPKLEVVRVWFALIIGTGWVFTSLGGIASLPTPTDWGSLALGFSNLYAFMVGFLYLRLKWK